MIQSGGFRGKLLGPLLRTGLPLSKMIQSGGFRGKLLGPLLRTGLPIMKSIIQPLAKGVLIPLGLTAAGAAADAGIHTKNLRIRS